jgi:hypothetical protein
MSGSGPKAAQAAHPLVEGQVVSGTFFSEPMRVETNRVSGPAHGFRPLRPQHRGIPQGHPRRNALNLLDAFVTPDRALGRPAP